MNTKVVIRPIEPTDAPDVQKYAADPRVSQTTNVPYPYPENGAEAFIEAARMARNAGQQYVFSIRYEESFVGVISLDAVNREEGTAELDYWLAPPCWNKGIATAATRQAIRYAFEEVGLSVLYSACLIEKHSPTWRDLWEAAL
jgi:RimJ/RimL family protein N-acetyltransferase